MALVRWDPFRELEEMSTRLDRFFGRNPRTESNTMSPEWAPPVDISENDREYLLKTELPSVDKNDVRVDVENGAADVRYEIDFRSVYARVIDAWLGADSRTILGGDFRNAALTFV